MQRIDIFERVGTTAVVAEHRCRREAALGADALTDARRRRCRRRRRELIDEGGHRVTGADAMLGAVRRC